MLTNEYIIILFIKKIAVGFWKTGCISNPLSQWILQIDFFFQIWNALLVAICFHYYKIFINQSYDFINHKYNKIIWKKYHKIIKKINNLIEYFFYTEVNSRVVQASSVHCEEYFILFQWKIKKNRKIYQVTIRPYCI